MRLLFSVILHSLNSILRNILLIDLQEISTNTFVSVLLNNKIPTVAKKTD